MIYCMGTLKINREKIMSRSEHSQAPAQASAQTSESEEVKPKAPEASTDRQTQDGETYFPPLGTEPRRKFATFQQRVLERRTIAPFFMKGERRKENWDAYCYFCRTKSEANSLVKVLKQFFKKKRVNIAAAIYLVHHKDDSKEDRIFVFLKLRHPCQTKSS